MATTKTLTPTNQAITLAAFTEKPDNRTNVTNDDKLADAVNTLNSNTAYNTQSFSSLADFKTFLNNMTVGKTSSLLLSGEASNAVCGSTYICSCKVYKIDNNFADIAWIRGNTQIGSARYQKIEGTFIINDINSKITAFAAVGATSGTTTNVEIQLPSNALFTSSQPLFMIASFRGSTSNANEGYAIIKIDNGVVYVTNKSGIQTLSNLAYNSSTKKLTFTSGTYITFIVFGLALS